MASPSAPIPKLVWRGGQEFTPDPGHTAVSVDTADSWLVENGRARGLAEHARRFTGSGPDPGRARAFLDAALPLIPATGRWFPRVEHHQGEYRLWIRPAPPPSSTVSLWFPGRPDPRVRPAVKGPDLAALIALRAEGAECGAGEAVLLSPQGWVREGALSSLMWWRGDVLCTSPAGPGVLPGVTRRLVLSLAGRAGQPVRFERARPPALVGLECWSMSALHGIRAVTGWVGTDRQSPVPVRAASWQARLMELTEPVEPVEPVEPAGHA